MFESCADEILAAMRRVTIKDIDLRSENQNNSLLHDNACKRWGFHVMVDHWTPLDTLTLLYDECHHCWWIKFTCTRNRRMLKSWAAKTQCYMTSIATLPSLSACLSLYVALTCCICPGSWGPRVSRPGVAPAKYPLTLDEFSATSHLRCPCHETETSHYVKHWYWPGGLTTYHSLSLGPGLPQAHITARLQGRVWTVAKIILRVDLRSGGVNTARGWAGGFISISTSYNMCKKCMWVYFSCSLIF